MRNMKYLVVLFALMCALTLTVCADDWFVGDWDDLTPTTEESTTQPGDTDTTAAETTAPEEQTTDPEESESELGSEPESESESESETTPESETSAEVETSEPEETTDASTTTGGEETTVQPSEGVTRPDDDDEDEKADDEETSYLPFILIGVALAVFGVAGIVLIIILLKKYFSANKQ